MSRRPNAGKKTNLSQFGLIDIPDLDDGDHEPMDLSDDDVDLEAELAAISGGGAKRHRPRKPAPVPTANLDAMIAASLKDVPSDDDVSADEDDPELLSELKELSIDDDEESAPAPVAPSRVSRPAPLPPSGSAESSTISLLQERISNYTLAEKNAKVNGESSRARRFGRGLKTLNDLLKQAKAGKPVSDEDIPPPVSLGKVEPSPGSAAASPPVPPPRSTSIETPSAPEPLINFSDDEGQPEPKEPPPPPPQEAGSGLSPERQQGLQFIIKRKKEFLAAALSAKQAGDKATALEFLKVVKQFEIVVEAYKGGQDMDLSELPTVESIAATLRSPKEEDHTQHASEPSPAEPPALVTASTVEEALKQRLAYFQQQETKAKDEDNSSKARRMGRIAKQYAEAVRHHAAGKPIAVDELPTPPGYAPIPGTESPSPAAAPAPSPRPSPAPRPSHAPDAPTPRPSSSRYEKQLAVLLMRQKQFKEAAVRAKKEGDIEQAKEYLRAAKGFDSVIEAARGGLAVDFKSLPLPPKAKNDLEHTFEEVSAEDCDPSPSSAGPILASDGDVMARLHHQLTTQLKLCLANREHNNAMGNVAEANRFEHLAVTVKQDLDVVAVAKSQGITPKFHYENRNFSVVQCNTALNENDLELTIVRGIAYNVPNPKEVDTYVRFEFPYPQEAPVSDRTVTVKDTNSPTYDAVFLLPIQRSSRACQRFFKRHGIKLEVYSKGGWFRSDALLGALTIKLAALETQVTIHDSFPIMDGRRPAGGSLEVKLRVRTPLVQQQIETTTHRWLVIDT